ncbi:LysR substrate-binding domain-containing protein [Cupriavidus basilensis]
MRSIAIIGRPPTDMRTRATSFAKHPMAFIAAPDHPLMTRRHLTLQDLVEAKPAGARARLGHAIPWSGCSGRRACGCRWGSELSSNAAIKRMVSAGLGVAFLSLHACTLEFQAGLIGLLPLQGNPIERDWYVLNLPGVRLPRVAVAFRAYLVEQGQAEINPAAGVLRRDIAPAACPCAAFAQEQSPTRRSMHEDEAGSLGGVRPRLPGRPVRVS